MAKVFVAAGPTQDHQGLGVQPSTGRARLGSSLWLTTGPARCQHGADLQSAGAWPPRPGCSQTPAPRPRPTRPATHPGSSQLRAAAKPPEEAPHTQWGRLATWPHRRTRAGPGYHAPWGPEPRQPWVGRTRPAGQLVHLSRGCLPAATGRELLPPQRAPGPSFGADGRPRPDPSSLCCRGPHPGRSGLTERGHGCAHSPPRLRPRPAGHGIHVEPDVRAP